MADSDKMVGLKNTLKKAMGINALVKSSDFQTYLLPYIEKLATIPPVDPTIFNNPQEYEFALKNANQEAVVYEKLLRFLRGQEAMVASLQEQIKKGDTTYTYE